MKINKTKRIPLEYQLGNDGIDSQHMTIICCLSDLVMLQANSTTTKASIHKILDELLSYSRIHFAYEQKIYYKGGYSDFENHCKLHKWFIQEVRKTQASDDLINKVSEIAQFLKKWFLEHILIEDKKAIDEINSKEEE